MRIFSLGIVACAALSMAQNQHESNAAEHRTESSGRYRAMARISIRPRKKAPKPEPIHFDIYERIKYTVFERVRFNLLASPWTFNITIGNQRQHIGSWWGPQHMGAETRDWLNEACKQTEKWGSEKCSSEPWSRSIEVGEKAHAKWIDDNAFLRISSHHIPEEYGVGLQEAFIEQIVDTFLLAVNNDKNCYFFDRLSTVCTIPCVRNKALCSVPPCRGCKSDDRDIILRWCNAPDYVRVAINDRNEIEKAHMRVDLKFKGEMWQGKFDCVAIIEDVVNGARTNRTEKLKAATKAKIIGTVVTCPEKEVTGSCPNKDCTYRPGMCFKKQKDTGY